MKNKTLLSIQTNLSDWHEQHSIFLYQRGEYFFDENQNHDIFLIKDKKDKDDFHLISFSDERLKFAKKIYLKVCIKRMKDCQTNFAVYLFDGVCVAIIDIEKLELLTGQINESTENFVYINKGDNGWIDLVIEIMLDKPSPIYLGCSLGNQPQYLGFGKDQFAIKNSIVIDILDYHDWSTLNPALIINQVNEISEFNVIDIGSADGIQHHWETFLFSDDKKFNYFLFEPSKKEAEKLTTRYKNFSNVKILEFALGNNNNNRSLNITVSEQCSSVRKPNMNILQKYPVSIMFEVKEKREVSFYRYDDLYKKSIVPSPDFIKIDVQGFEYEVIEGFGDLIRKCIGIELEAHFYEVYIGQKLLGDIVNLLLSHGLYLRDIRPQWSFGNDLVEVNAIFTQSIEKLTEQSQKNKLKLIESVLQLRS